MIYFYLFPLIAIAFFFLRNKWLRLERNTEEDGGEEKMGSSSPKNDALKTKALGAGGGNSGEGKVAIEDRRTMA